MFFFNILWFILCSKNSNLLFAALFLILFCLPSNNNMSFVEDVFHFTTFDIPSIYQYDGFISLLRVSAHNPT